MKVSLLFLFSHDHSHLWYREAREFGDYNAMAEETHLQHFTRVARLRFVDKMGVERDVLEGGFSGSIDHILVVEVLLLDVERLMDIGVERPSF